MARLSRFFPVSDRLSGYIPDLPTPFEANGNIDWGALEAHCLRMIRAGARAVVVAETTGEASTLTADEHRLVVDFVTMILRGRAAVLAGASSNATSCAVALARQAEAAGADGIVAVVPYYNKPMQAGILAHFRALAEATRLPIIIHDAPARTARALADETVVVLATDPQFIGMCDGAGDPARPVRLRRRVRPGFRLLAGDDASAMAYVAQGGDGCVSQAANLVPALCQHLHADAHWGETSLAATVRVDIAALCALLAEDGAPAALKYALHLQGAMTATVRRPLVEPSGATKSELRSLLGRLLADQPGGELRTAATPPVRVAARPS